MNVYEEAHNLARSIRESNEYKDFAQKKKEIDEDPDTSNMITELHTLQVQLQAKQMTGEQPDPEMMQRVQSLYAMVMTKPKAADYLQAEVRFGIMVKDVYEILAEVINV